MSEIDGDGKTLNLYVLKDARGVRICYFVMTPEHQRRGVCRVNGSTQETPLSVLRDLVTTPEQRAQAEREAKAAHMAGQLRRFNEARYNSGITYTFPEQRDGRSCGHCHSTLLDTATCGSLDMRHCRDCGRNFRVKAAEAKAYYRHY